MGNFSIKVEQKILGLWQTNCWLVWIEPENLCAVIDPGAGAREIWKWIQLKGLNLKFILLTHSHFDHIGGARYLQRMSSAICYLHRKDIRNRWRWLGISFARFSAVKDGDEIPFGPFRFRVFHTPGHSPGSVCYFIEDYLFCGDLLFAGGVGRWDIPGGSFRSLVKSLKNTLSQFPDETKIMPGHGPSTTLGIERMRNALLSGTGIK